MKSYTAEELKSMSREELLSVAKENLVNTVNLDKRTIEFEYDNKGFEGLFIFKYPSLMDNLKIGVMKAKLCEGIQDLDVTTDNIAFMYSMLSVCKIKAPDWFDINKLTDYTVLEEIYNNFNTQVLAIRSSFD